MIEAVNLTKQYGDKVAVDHISFTVEPGTVTGFLGPNGAGKSTTMRMIMGLDKPTTGSVKVNGRPYRKLTAPLCEVGALLDAKGLHGSRSARAHLRQLAVSNGIPVKRVDEVLEITGLTDVAKKRVKGFSLGMGQRLGMAAALLGDPQTLLFVKPRVLWRLIYLVPVVVGCDCSWRWWSWWVSGAQAASCSAGVRIPIAECGRVVLNQWTHSAVATSTASMSSQGPWLRMSSALYSELSASARALS